MAKTLKIKKQIIVGIKPMLNKILTTADVYKTEECYSRTGILMSDQIGKIKQIQRVISVGPIVREVKEGDLIFIDFTPYEKRQYSKDTLKETMKDEFYNKVIEYVIPTIVLDNKPHLLINDSYVSYIITEDREEEVEISLSDLIVPKTIITP